MKFKSLTLRVTVEDSVRIDWIIRLGVEQFGLTQFVEHEQIHSSDQKILWDNLWDKAKLLIEKEMANGNHAI